MTGERGQRKRTPDDERDRGERMPDGERDHGTEALSVLAVTAFRPHEVVEPLRRTEGPVAVVTVDGDAGFLRRNLAVVRETRRAIRADAPDVALVDAKALFGLLAALVARLAGVPVVYRFKGNYWQELAEARDTGGYRRRLAALAVGVLNAAVFRLASGYVVVSRDLRDVVVRRLDCPPERVAVVHVPVETNRPDGSAAAARDRLGIDADTVVLTVTNLKFRGKYKGTRTALDGMARVMGRRDDVAYVVAGGGAYHGDLVSAMDGLDPTVRERTYAPGYLEGVEDLYALADGFVYVSHIDGYPKSVLEAQLAGLPVVVNAAHGMVEQVDHGRTGLVLDETTPGAVAAAVERLLAAPEERRALGDAARRAVRRENDPTVVGRRLRAAVARIHADLDRVGA